MTRSGILKTFILLLFLMFSLLVLNNCTNKIPCTDKEGCKYPRVCVDGYCVYPTEEEIPDVIDQAEDIVVIPEACISVSTDFVDFGRVDRFEFLSQSFFIESCGTAPLDINSIGFADGTAPEFTLRNDPSGLRIAPGDAIEVGVSFVCNDEVNSTGTILIYSNSADDPVVEINLRAMGQGNHCPTVEMSYFSVNTSEQGMITGGYPFELTAQPLDTLLLESIGFDDDGWIIDYSWTLVTRPEDSHAILEASEESANIFLDLAGHYQIINTITDNEDMESCEPIILDIEVIPIDSIHVQLVWTLPCFETSDCEADVDLHMLYSDDYQWTSTPYDCFYANMTPNWSNPNSNADDPSLDIDNLVGDGPENINLDSPEQNHKYEVGVHYYSDHGSGPGQITVRIYLNGQLEYVYENHPLSDQQFWHVASILWDLYDGIVEEINITYDFTP